MSDINFAKGMTVKTIKKDGWEIIKLGFQHDQFYENPINERGYINIVLKRGKDSGNWYATIDDYKPKNQDANVVNFDDDEIPF